MNELTVRNRSFAGIVASDVHEYDERGLEIKCTTEIKNDNPFLPNHKIKQTRTVERKGSNAITDSYALLDGSMICREENYNYVKNIDTLGTCLDCGIVYGKTEKTAINSFDYDYNALFPKLSALSESLQEQDYNKKM